MCSVATGVDLDPQKDDKGQTNAKEDDGGAIKELNSTSEPAGQSNRKESVSSKLPKGQDLEEDGKGVETTNLSGGEKDVEMATDSSSTVKSQKPVKANPSANSLDSTRASKNKDKGSKSLPADKDETRYPVTSVENELDNSTVQNRARILSIPLFSLCIQACVCALLLLQCLKVN